MTEKPKNPHAGIILKEDMKRALERAQWELQYARICSEIASLMYSESKKLDAFKNKAIGHIQKLARERAILILSNLYDESKYHSLQYSVPFIIKNIDLSQDLYAEPLKKLLLDLGITSNKIDKILNSTDRLIATLRQNIQKEQLHVFHTHRNNYQAHPTLVDEIEVPDGVTVALLIEDTHNLLRKISAAYYPSFDYDSYDLAQLKMSFRDLFRDDPYDEN